MDYIVILWLAKKANMKRLGLILEKKRNINLDKVEFKISTFFDISRKDKKKLDSFIQERNKKWVK